MSDVFISYARSSEEQAKQVEEALRAGGYGVWRDAELPAHRTYAEVIEERLKSAKAVVVLWSSEATKSQWVRAEADAARELGTLIQASVDGTMPPIPFNQIQCADLKGWDGHANHSGWGKLKGSVAALLGGSGNPGESPAARRQKRSVCVLPFVNMSGDMEQEYFSDGISEDITTDLSKVSALEVIARNTAFMFKGQSVDVTEIARKLGVSHILEGSVRKAGNRVRITAQLIDGHKGGHVWAERYDRDLTDIFAIQDEISKAIVTALKLKLLPKEKKAMEQRGTTSAEAYNLYLMARQYWITGNHGDPRREERVVRICQRAVEIDPTYAKAWGLMALAQTNLSFGYSRPGAGEGGIVFADKALALDPNIAEAHCAKAQNLAYEGKIDEANEEIATALKIDPESWEANKEAARLAMLQDQIPEATEYYEKAASLIEGDYHSWGMLVSCYHAQGDEESVRNAAKMVVEGAEKAVVEDPGNGAAMGQIACGLAILGESERAKEWIDRALMLDPDNTNMRYNFACALAGYIDEPDAALDLLEPAFATCGALMLKLAHTDPDFDTLRGNARFERMLSDARKRLGIAGPPATRAASSARPNV